jgi:prepilin-type N-terminal cleavage/methylation domain-containing protein
MKQTLKRHQSERGFTFIEILVALTLLAAAAGLLIGLQSAAVRRTLRDTQAQQAMLAARRIMSSIESMKKDSFDLSNQDNQPVASVLQALGVPASSDPSEQDALASLAASIQIEDWILPLPDMDQNPMKKITMKIAWGVAPDESISILYLFSPS